MIWAALRSRVGSNQIGRVYMKKEKEFADTKKRALVDYQDRMFKIFCNLAFRIEGPPCDEFLEYFDLRKMSYDLISQMDQ